MISALPSEHVAAIRDALRPHQKRGVEFTPDQIVSFCKRLRTVIEICREVEDENRILGKALREAEAKLGRPRPLIPAAGNVVHFRPQPVSGRRAVLNVIHALTAYEQTKHTVGERAALEYLLAQAATLRASEVANANHA
ncbi:hypothetical protein P7F60_06385 [Rhizobium sp. YJ-22]|uniref:hypothetical protein n=1 Tax=Rhizobium sp. YJ-22 TaxID=3037556 RepID=UPI0024127634|nr:hypothetical protein [Rhizobium sp. YJ-22]MDG3576004.1 hypothetical protein [Rhizobium sp. YJ-22]